MHVSRLEAYLDSSWEESSFNGYVSMDQQFLEPANPYPTILLAR
jgi:hypothetical protein